MTKKVFNIRMSKKTKKSIKPNKLKKKYKKTELWKNRLKFLKNRPVRFYKPETEKTEPKQKKTENKTEPNRF
jgi:nuclear transport factor 2 (NTF2) superfamily protein